MAGDPLQPDLMPSLRRLVRGLEVLFWSLPAALVVCVAESVSLEWQSWGVLPLVLVMGLLCRSPRARMSAAEALEHPWFDQQAPVTVPRAPPGPRRDTHDAR